MHLLLSVIFFMLSCTINASPVRLKARGGETTRPMQGSIPSSGTGAPSNHGGPSSTCEMGPVQRLWEKRETHGPPDVPADIFVGPWDSHKSGHPLIMTINGELTPKHHAMAQAFKQLDMLIGLGRKSQINGKVVSYIAIQTIGGFTEDLHVFMMGKEKQLQLIKEVKDRLTGMSITLGPNIDNPDFYTFNNDHSQAYPFFGAIGGYTGEHLLDLPAIEEFCSRSV